MFDWMRSVSMEALFLQFDVHSLGCQCYSAVISMILLFGLFGSRYGQNTSKLLAGLMRFVVPYVRIFSTT